MSKFKVGDRVSITDRIPSSWWFKPGALATIESVGSSATRRYRLRFDQPDKDGWNNGVVSDEHIELVRTPANELIQADIRLTTLERYTLIGALCDKLKWLHDHGGTRADHVGAAERLLEITKTLPDDGDAA